RVGLTLEPVSERSTGGGGGRFSVWCLRPPLGGGDARNHGALFWGRGGHSGAPWAREGCRALGPAYPLQSPECGRLPTYEAGASSMVPQMHTGICRCFRRRG